MDSVSVTDFRAALSRFASGVTVVTVRDADGVDHGMTVSAFTSLSLDPPLVLACLDRVATVLPHLLAAERFGVSILAEGQDVISARFAEQGVVRFDGVAVSRAAGGPVLIDGAVAHLVCRRVAEFPGGDHVIVVGAIESARALGERPLLYAMRQYGSFTPDSGR
jgi:flavin reductase (DIM6/NTAB) family NADH-FMN oxidoreductase RutF